MWIFLPLGVMLFFTGFFISSITRQMEYILLMKGDVIRPAWLNESYRVTSLKTGIQEGLTAQDTEKGIFAYEPKVIISDESSNSFEIGAFPPSRIKGTYFHILNFGIAPGILVNESGEKKVEGYMALSIRTAGSTDFFDIPSYQYRVGVTMLAPKNKNEYPFKARIFKGEKVIAEGDPYKGINFDNLTLYFTDHTYWVQLSVVTDKGILIIVSSLAIILIGLPLSALRLIFRSKMVYNLNK